MPHNDESTLSYSEGTHTLMICRPLDHALIMEPPFDIAVMWPTRWMETKVMIDLQTIKLNFAPLYISGRTELVGKGHGL